MSTLDAFITHSKPPPTPIATSLEIRDRASIFVGTIFRVSSLADVHRCVAHLRHITHGSRPATHEMHAWRIMQTKAGRTGLGGPDDFELNTGSKDDGEQWAGNRILRVMEAQGVLDAVVVVSRWYGGTMLGPTRFDHIETCATEVCQAFKKKVEAEEFLITLTTLDDLLAELRAQLAEKKRVAKAREEEAKGSPRTIGSETQALSDSTSQTKVTTPPSPKSAATPSLPHAHASVPPPKPPDYASWIENDIPRARKLVRARELSIKAVKSALAKLDAEKEQKTKAEHPSRSAPTTSDSASR
ncbi:ribosomal protein S5 domain 2-like protein [Schizophyllum commune Tattone D]|nr:ribosomal protein S5 domain 2-like protein [Schizophyllum commune Tattone D]